MALFQRLFGGMKKTRDTMENAIDAAMEEVGGELTEEVFEQLEEILILSDTGMGTALEIIESLRERAKRQKIKSAAGVKAALRGIVAELLSGGGEVDMITMPAIILVIGVNGVGKTTSIGKLAAMYRAGGKKVLLGAADTFRAAAIEQLEIWAQRAQVDLVKHREGADPAAVVFDTIQAGKARGVDLIVCDTAGRLHNKKHLMEELGKMYRVIDRELPYSDREVLLVLDATTGQNAVSQAREFKEIAEVTGIILTKLDGTAKGGVVLNIRHELNIPVKFIGVGEGIDDLQPFDPEAFADAMFGEGA
ncbi:MAG: signal recognition particle-docking protein FtsY [Oscillospiraceae bacterium]|jgi:fused signal recognition particle receptor|nr:signal recognition particle-docking protein FtsY [Oscillospiraceae bacterium]